MAAQQPSAAVLAARARRSGAGAERAARIDWFADNVIDKVAMTLRQRTKIATDMLKDQVVRNISRPVTKLKTGGGRDSAGRFLKTSQKVTDRSKPGEFPKADTTQLMKTIFSDTVKTASGYEGYVGTPLDYGVILETRRQRSFLVRTLNEMRPQITRILTGPIK